jgi:hypothetical protein
MEGLMKPICFVSILSSIAFSVIGCTDEGLPTEPLMRGGGKYTGTVSATYPTDIPYNSPRTLAGTISIQFFADSSYSYSAKVLYSTSAPLDSALLGGAGIYSQLEHEIRMWEYYSCSHCNGSSLNFPGTYTIQWRGVHLIIDGENPIGEKHLDLVLSN